MGLDLIWYRVARNGIKDYLRKKERFYNLEERLNLKYADAIQKSNEEFDRQMDAVDELPFNEQKRAADKIRITTADDIYNSKDLHSYILAKEKMEACRRFAWIVELPQLYLRKQYWLVQWILNRRRNQLVVSPDEEDMGELVPRNERWSFVLTDTDIKDLVSRIKAVTDNVKCFYDQFPVYKDLYYGHQRNSRKFHAYERKEMTAFDFKGYLYHLEYALKYIVTAGYTLMLDVDI